MFNKSFSISTRAIAFCLSENLRRHAAIWSPNAASSSCCCCPWIVSSREIRALSKSLTSTCCLRLLRRGCSVGSGCGVDEVLAGVLGVVL